ncbi:carbohydrate ABC transporter permease [Marinitenerispora sediminis]|uniref:ABC transporter permease n=1 Tax=Marinitenerispora sediminis TaxID=1931232 RepID=A0A368T709_9ACTN|nr:ABC transporter permease [Marinitenerispora sediminis]RCV52612.1 ABC transporter permease [Marinitenerispora sediminis]RCV59579.1 ABC transporter permease [Marinitenerispora sediminis]
MTTLDRGGPGAPPGPPPGAGRGRPTTGDDARERRRALAGRLDAKGSPYLFIAPFFLLFGVFGLFPLLYTVWVSLHEWSLIGGNEGFVGLDNYVRLATDGKFWNALYNTIGIFAIAVVPQLLMALLLADLLNRRLRWSGFFRIGLILPYVTSIAAVAIVFGQLFGPQFGMVNYLLELAGVDPVDWRGEKYASWVAIAVMIDWRWTGYNALIYLAAMQAVPRDVYEAAAIDGASRLRQFWQITIPLLRPTIIFTVIIATIGQMQLFTEPAVFGTDGAMNGGTQSQFQTVMMLVYQEAFRYGNYGYGSAIAWMLFLLIVLFSLLNVLVTSRIRSAT